MFKVFFKVILVLVVVSAGLSLWLYSQFVGAAVEDKFSLSISREVVDTDLDGYIAEHLLPNIKHDFAFKIYSSYLDLNSSIKVGNYSFEPGMSVIRIVRMLKLGEQQAVNVTFNNIRTLPELAGRISGQLDLDSLELLKHLQSSEVAAGYNQSTSTMISMFIPNTYQLYWNTSAQGFTDRINSEYKRFWNSDRMTKAEKVGLSQLEVMTLASIVYEETKQQSEMARVAGVYLNRLRIGMPLQADPTVKFAIGDFTIKRVLNKHLEYDSPYNTYKYAGLPPAPIAMPSIAAIDAVLSPEKHSYLYFCARPTFDGFHNFAKTLSEHNANARAYINELNRLKIK
ncbi:MAG: endolytic transglycosylase MltG [Rikenellaceae bacterium]